MMALKAMRTVSTVVAMFVMRRRSRPATGDSEAAEEGSVSSATLLDSVREGMTGLYAKGEALWGDFLELVFKAAGDEIALAGLRVSRGHVLSEDEKAHVRALVEEEERVAALEAEGQDGGAGEASVYGGATPGVQSREVRLGLRTATEEEVAAADKGSESRSFGDVVASFLPTGSGGGAGGGMMGALATMFAGRKNAQIAPALEQGEAGGEVASAGSQPEARQSGEQEGVGQGKGGGETRSETMVLRQPEGQGSAPASTCDVAQEEVSDASGVALQEEDKKLELRAGRLDEELSVGEEQEERGEDGETDGETAQKATPSIIDMIPSAYQPVAFGGACAGFMCMLASKLFAMDAALACTSIGKLPKKTALQSQGPLREKQLADLVVAAFDDAKVPRDRFLPRLSAVLAAVGSAQGFLRVFFTEDSKPVRAPVPVSKGCVGPTGIHQKCYAMSSVCTFTPELTCLGTFACGAGLLRRRQQRVTGVDYVADGQVREHLQRTHDLVHCLDSTLWPWLLQQEGRLLCGHPRSQVCLLGVRLAGWCRDGGHARRQALPGAQHCILSILSRFPFVCSHALEGPLSRAFIPRLHTRLRHLVCSTPTTSR